MPGLTRSVGAWNRAAFWFTRDTSALEGAAVRSLWMAVPGWLPVPLIAVVWIRSRRARPRAEG